MQWSSGDSYCSDDSEEENQQESEEKSRQERLQRRVIEYLEMKNQQGFDLNTSLTEMHAFKNPYILDRICQMYDIDQHGTNLIHKISFSSEDYFDAITARQLQQESKRRENRD